MREVNKDTIIDYGMQISPNLIVDHLTTGAYSTMLGEWIPKYPAKILPANINGVLRLTGMEGWQIVRNLQISAENVLENLLREVGSDLIIRSGFNINENMMKNPLEALHSIGRSFDVQISGYQDNMFNVAKDIQRIANKASSMQLVYGSSSWIHMNINPQKALDTAIKQTLPEMKTVDANLGIIENGLTSLRGFL